MDARIHGYRVAEGGDPGYGRVVHGGGPRIDPG